MSNNKKLPKEAKDIWNRNFGKSVSKTIDFAGREINKGAYDNKNSDFAWNIDHIKPISLNGPKNDEKNMICCHILTNREKSNSYPEFTANNKQFKVIEKDDGTREIVEINKKETYSMKSLQKIIGSINNQNISLITKIRIRHLIEKKVIDFIYDLYKNENVNVIYSEQQEVWSEDMIKTYYNAEVTIKVYNLENEIFQLNEQLQNNIKMYTMLKSFFIEKKYLNSFWINFDMVTEIDDIKLLVKNQTSNYFNLDEFNSLIINNEILKKLNKPIKNKGNKFVLYDELDQDLLKEIQKIN